MTRALRAWRNAQGVALPAIAALAVGIGSATAIYTVVDAVLFRPLPFTHPERYVSLFSARKGESGWSGTSWLNLLEYKRRTTSFDSFGIYQPREFSLTAPGPPRHLTAVEVTPSLIRNLGIEPIAGRWFDEAEREQGSVKLAVISASLWKSLGGDPGIAGKTVTLDGAQYTVTGVAPAWFRFPVSGTAGEEVRADVWVPLDPRGRNRDRNYAAYFCNARMKPGATPAQADADVKRAAAQIGREFIHDPGYTAAVNDLRDAAVKDIRPTLLLLLGAASALLSIACANVAGLLLARSVARARETAIRIALGATRLQLAAQFFAEGLLLALAGVVAGVFVGVALVRFVLSIAAGWIPRADEIGVSGAALVFACAAGGVSCLLFSLAPLWQASKTLPNETLSDGARSSASARSRYLSRSLVIAEIALAFALLSTGAVLLTNFSGLLGTYPGFDPEHLLTFSLNIGMAQYPKMEGRDAYQKRLAASIAAIPGVEGAAFVDHIPLAGCCFLTTLTPDGRSLNPVADKVAYLVASDNYPQVMRIPVLNGRFLRDSDAVNELGAVINRRAAKALWPGQNPVGKFGRLSGNGSRARIVGVVGDVKNNELGLPAEPEVYLVALAIPMNPASVVVRSRLEAAQLLPSIRRAVLGVDKTQALYDVRTMHEIILDSLGTDRLRAYLIAFFAASALLMAGLGVYGVVAYSVRNRTVEIGTRMALGAARRDVLRLIVGEGLKMAGWGILAGGVAVAGAVLLLHSEIFGIPIGGPQPFLWSMGIVAALTSLACAAPAGRALLISPMVAIRDDAGSLWQRARALVRRSDDEGIDIEEGVLLAEFVEASRTAASFREAIAISLGTVRAVLVASSAEVIEKDKLGTYPLLTGRFLHYPFALPLSEGDYDAWERWAEAAGPDQREDHREEIAALRERRIALAVPLLAKKEIAGLLLLGPPVNRAAYGKTERRVLQNCAGQFALLLENARLTDRIVDQEKLRRDVQLATEVQKRLMPDRAPAAAGIALAGMSIPARGVGGDYYDFLDLGNQKIGIALADVAGKGVAAALIMSVVQASLRIIAGEDISLAAVAAKMNRFLYKSTRSNGYATFFYACVDTGSAESRRQLRYVNAGHNPPFLLRRTAAGTVEELPAGGTVIGLFPQMSYAEAAIDLTPGDVLMAFTDGVPEAQNPAEEEFGEERVRQLLVRFADRDVESLAAEIAAELKAWIAGADQYDDLTFILLKVL